MPRGDKSKYTNKQDRQADHIEEGYEKRGVSKGEAERRAWATVNKMSGGGKKSGSGRGRKTNKAPARKGGRKGAASRKAAAGKTSRKSTARKSASRSGGRKTSSKSSGRKTSTKSGGRKTSSKSFSSRPCRCPRICLIVRSTSSIVSRSPSACASSDSCRNDVAGGARNT
jgi:plasmid stabilization system protein ParE